LASRIGIESALRACLEIVNRRIAALSKRRIDTFHDDVMDFAALLEGCFTQSLMNRFGQVEAGMDDIWPWLASTSAYRSFFSVLWVGGVMIQTWRTFPVDYSSLSPPGFVETTPPPFDPSKPYHVVLDSERREAAQFA
jgi:hypothetical protein